MSKTRKSLHRYNKNKKSNKNFLRKFRKTTARAIPIVASGLKKVGSSVKNITMKSRPLVEKGLGVLYNSVMTGFDLGVKGIKKGVNVIKSKSASKTRRHK
jgi:hypothetical protein